MNLKSHLVLPPAEIAKKIIEVNTEKDDISTMIQCRITLRNKLDLSGQLFFWNSVQGLSYGAIYAKNSGISYFHFDEIVSVHVTESFLNHPIFQKV